MLCERVIEAKCSKGHVQRRMCHMNQPAMCRTCQREDEKRQRELQAELERQSRRDQEQRQHAAKMAEIDRQIRLVREQMADEKTAEENTRALEQKKRDLEAARHIAQQTADAPVNSTKLETRTAPSTAPTSSLDDSLNSHQGQVHQAPPVGDQHESEQTKLACEQEWDRQKRVDGASNAAIDALMALTGLEDAKSKILNIKAKIETVLRQGTDMKDERLGIVLLGNPGTGRSRAHISWNLLMLCTRQDYRRPIICPISLFGRRTPGQ
jgi:hypothetical protein